MVVISVLNTLDTFALRAYDPTGGTLETDDEHISKLCVQWQSMIFAIIIWFLPDGTEHIAGSNIPTCTQ